MNRVASLSTTAVLGALMLLASAAWVVVVWKTGAVAGSALSMVWLLVLWAA